MTTKQADAVVDPGAVDTETDTDKTEVTPADLVVDPEAVEEVEPQTEEVAEAAKWNPTPEPEKIDEELLKQAVKAGVSQTQIDSLDALSLQRIVRKLNAQFSATSDATPASDAAKTLGESKSGTQYKLDVPDDTYEQELVDSVDNAVGRLATDTQDQIQRLINQNKSLMADAAVREEREANIRFDNMISGLTDYQEEFGVDNPTRSQQASRNELRSDMNVICQGRELDGLPALDEKQLREKALAGLYIDKPKQLAREEITGKLKVRKKQIIARPTNSKGPRRTGTENAVRNVAESLAALGADTTTSVVESDMEALESMLE